MCKNSWFLLSWSQMSTGISVGIGGDLPCLLLLLFISTIPNFELKMFLVVSCIYTDHYVCAKLYVKFAISGKWLDHFPCHVE